MTKEEAKKILKENAVPTFPMRITPKEWHEALNMTLEILDKE